MSAHELITDHLDLWTQAVTKKSTAGRGSNGKVELTGIKKLRELILELAVRGKLVEQDPDDEPASVLLEQVANEKAQLAKVGKIKKSKKLPDIGEKEKPFGLPDGWLWARLEAISEYIQRGKGPKYAETGGVRVVSQKCVQWSGFDLSVSRFVDDSSLDGYQDERYIRDGDVLWNSTGTGTVGRAIVIKKPQYSIVADSHVTIVRLLIAEPSYVLNYISSPSVQYRIEPGHENSLVSGTTKQVELNSGSVKLLPVPLPPLKEQHRIVQKVDELMALCDRLEQQTSDQLDAHETLVDTLLGTLTQSENATELADNWARLAEYFDTLFTTEQSIDKLKQTILQLAVMGRLVEQDAGEEKACILLESILHKKKELVHNKVFQKTSKLKDTRVQFNLPEGWVATKMGEICSSIVPSRDKPKTFTGSIPWITLPAFPDSSWYLDTTKIETGLSAKEVSAYSARIIPPGSVMMSCVGRFGLTAINKTAVVANQQVHAFIPLKGISPEFLSMVIKVAATSLEQTATSTTIKYLNKTNCESIPLALPPLAEQHRIVKKVDELMALCDHLKQHLAQASNTRCQLAGAVVEGALEG